MQMMKSNNWGKLALGALLGATLCGGLASCQDTYDLDEPGNRPDWLGYSIYETLKKPESTKLSGTFNNYVRLIDDLGYRETLERTGSKTLFPANDEAFGRFYADNQMGVHSYEDLTESQKKLIFYGSMLDNAILTEMLSNVSAGGNNVIRGQAMKHQTTINVIDSVTWIPDSTRMPENNRYWDAFHKKGIYIVSDATRPMMIHFTKEQMIANNIKLTGDDSDFEVITGAPFDDKVGQRSAYIFRDRVIQPDITCMNGYIHQVEDVLVPMGNVAELIRTGQDSKLFSRMLERFSYPVANGTLLRQYNDYLVQNGGTPIPDSVGIYQRRYLSNRSQGGNTNKTDPITQRTFQYPLKFDPGWNTYYPDQANQIADIAAMFVPTDKAMEEYFLPGGEGSFLIDVFGLKDGNGNPVNDREHLAQNIDSLSIEVVQPFLNNLMKPSFVGTVPSKFSGIMNDAQEPLGLTLSAINRQPDGKYDVRIGNNGVIYMLNKVFAPDQFVSVYAPTLYSENLQIMKQAIEDGKDNTNIGMGLNFYAYLMAMKANYALFLPTDEAFASPFYYVDPAYLGHEIPRVLKFDIDSITKNVVCETMTYDPVTREILDSIPNRTAIANVTSQLQDILDYHTIVLRQGEQLGLNRYYKTKHGGEIRFDRDSVLSGGQIDNDLEASHVTQVYTEKNGVAYVIDHPIQPTQQSVYAILNDSVNNPQFTLFMDLCVDERQDELMQWASEELIGNDPITKRPKTERFHVFVTGNGNYGLDYNVNYFSSYNYTVYAPNNTAMTRAINNYGLPTWDKVQELYDKWDFEDPEQELELTDEEREERETDKLKALAMITEINAFIRYHFQNTSIYVDNIVRSDNLNDINTTVGEEFSTAYTSELGVKQRLTVVGGSNEFTVKDACGQQIKISGANGLKVNLMARDYVFDQTARRATKINTSSFAVIHELSSSLSPHKTRRYDSYWTGDNVRERLKAARKTFLNQLNSGF